MNDIDSYDDPILAARARAWMQDAAPVSAPERLVFSVMDDVERSPRRRRGAFRGVPILTGLARYAALTIAITIGVAAGIAVSRSFESVGGPPPPTPVPSLRLVSEPAGDGRLLTSDATRAWLVTRTNQLVPIEGGATGVPISITFAPTDMIARTDTSTAYGGKETVWLVAPDADLLRLDPTVGEFVATPGARGTRVTLGAGAAWVGRDGEVLKVDAGPMELLTTVKVPGHRAADPLLVVGDTLWVGTASLIERRDGSSGGLTARIRVVPSSLVSARGLVWAAEGSRLLAIDPGSGEIALSAALPPGTPEILAVATHGDVIWLATGSGPGGPLLIGIDPATGQTVSVTPLATPAISIAVDGNQVWTLDANGHVGRFEPG